MRSASSSLAAAVAWARIVCSSSVWRSTCSRRASTALLRAVAFHAGRRELRLELVRCRRAFAAATAVRGGKLGLELVGGRRALAQRGQFALELRDGVALGALLLLDLGAHRRELFARETGAVLGGDSRLLLARPAVLGGDPRLLLAGDVVLGGDPCLLRRGRRGPRRRSVPAPRARRGPRPRSAPAPRARRGPRRRFAPAPRAPTRSSARCAQAPRGRRAPRPRHGPAPRARRAPSARASPSSLRGSARVRAGRSAARAWVAGARSSRSAAPASVVRARWLGSAGAGLRFVRALASLGRGRSTTPPLVSSAKTSLESLSAPAEAENATRQSGGSGPACGDASSGPGNGASRRVRSPSSSSSAGRVSRCAASARQRPDTRSSTVSPPAAIRSKRSTSNSGARPLKIELSLGLRGPFSRARTRSPACRRRRSRGSAAASPAASSSYASAIVSKKLCSSCSRRSGATRRDCCRARAVTASIRSSSVRSGTRPARRERVELRDRVDPEPASSALVGERRVDEAVEQDPRPGIEPRSQALVDELGAGGRIEQRLGARVAAQPAVRDELADALGERDAAGFAQQLDGPIAGELGVQGGRERRLPGAVDALQRDQPSAHGCDATVLR